MRSLSRFNSGFIRKAEAGKDVHRASENRHRRSPHGDHHCNSCRGDDDGPVPHREAGEDKKTATAKENEHLYGQWDRPFDVSCLGGGRC